MEHVFARDEKTAVVTTEAGKVRGYLYNGISIFKGIRYAQAKRFHAPEPVRPWEGVWDASNYGFVCPYVDKKPWLSQELYLPHRYWITDEDCQNLNIWTPACDGEKRPVLVWLHGGGFNMGSAIEMAAYDGENMCRLGQVVVVSVNHRLNLLGYFDLSDFGEEYANSGNAGTDDLIAALRWVRDNIERFGGDPENVTLFGQSGGGAKITALLQSPGADGLFAKGINMSGVLQNGVVGSYAKSGRRLGEVMMQELGVHGVKELETVPYEALAAAYAEKLKHLREIIGVPQADDGRILELTARFPDVITVEKAQKEEEVLWEILLPALEDAVSRFLAMRETEGENLKQDILQKGEKIRALVAGVKERAPLVVEEYREKLNRRLEDILGNVEVDPQRVAQEVAVFADRGCIDEEITRLESHLIQLDGILREGGQVGRKLDFLVQEMNRESNTIASKANDVQIVQATIALKSEIEKIREQVQNLE